MDMRATQRDFAYMRAQRLGGERMAENVRKTGIAVIAGGLLWALWEGIKIALATKGVLP